MIKLFKILFLNKSVCNEWGNEVMSENKILFTMDNISLIHFLDF